MNKLTISRLAEIANTVNAEHNELESMLKSSMARAVNIGRLLTEAKQLAGHGNWGAWLKNNCQFSERTAQNYMRVFASYPELSKSATVADLTYKQALGLLTEPKEPEYEIHEICALYPMTEEDIERMADSMRQVGYEKLFPITLYEGKILDGKLRYEAAKRAGVKPVYRTFEGDGYEALQFTFQANMIRSHFTDDRLIAHAVGVSHEEINKAQNEANALEADFLNRVNKDNLTLAKDLEEVIGEIATLDAEYKNAQTLEDLHNVIKRAYDLQNKANENRLRCLRYLGEALNILEAAGGDA